LSSKLKSKLRAFEDRLTVRQQIGAATAVLCLVLAGLLAISAATVSHNRVERLVGEEMANYSAAVSQSLELFMHARYQEIRTLAALEVLREVWLTDAARIRGAFEGLQDGLPHFAWVGFTTTDGIVRVASKGMLEGRSVVGLPWFKNGLHAPTAVDVHSVLLLEELLGPAANNEPLRFVDVAAPVLDAQGKTIGVLSAHLNWNWAVELRDNFLKRRLTADTRISIVAGDGVVLLGERLGERILTPDELRRMQVHGSGALTIDNGQPMLTGYAVNDGYLDYPGLGWIVIAQRPADLALAAARNTAWIILGMGAVLALLAVGVSMFIASRVARPLRALTLEADRIGRDPGAPMLRLQHGSAEVLQLSTALRSLLHRLGFAERRTKEIEASASESARQFAEDLRAMRHLAETDPLTGLTNRRALLKEGAAAFEHFKRYQRPFAILAADIDHFKQINDRYGHAAGDAGIRKTGEIVRSTLRTTDTAARIGGEEFIVLLREVDEAAARQLAERIRAAVEACTITSGDTQFNLTISIGIALARSSDHDIAEVIERADQGLYMAKNTGRNRVLFMPAQDARHVA
jgi:diguanylate cyclase (GGDEF)-like protein